MKQYAVYTHRTSRSSIIFIDDTYGKDSERQINNIQDPDPGQRCMGRSRHHWMVQTESNIGTLAAYSLHRPSLTVGFLPI